MMIARCDGIKRSQVLLSGIPQAYLQEPSQRHRRPSPLESAAIRDPPATIELDSSH